MVEIYGVIYKLKDELFGIVCNGRNVVKNFLEILLHKALIGIFLNLYQVGHIKNFIDMGKAHALFLAHVNLMHHRVHSLYFVITI